MHRLYLKSLKPSNFRITMQDKTSSESKEVSKDEQTASQSSPTFINMVIRGMCTERASVLFAYITNLSVLLTRYINTLYVQCESKKLHHIIFAITLSKQALFS